MKRNNQTIYFDEFGEEYALDADGNRIVPTQAAPMIDLVSNWTHYDTSRGHCGLCGSLTCRGSCFK